MNSKGIGIGLVVLAALALATVYVYRTPASDNATVTDPWTALDKNRVDHVILHRPSAPAAEQSIELSKSNGSWTMTAPGQGPTEGRSVTDLLDALGDMHAVSIAGRNVASYEGFEVDDAHATHVTLKNGSAVLLDIFVGAPVDNGTAIRVPGHTEIYRVNKSLHSMVTRAPRDWRDRDITRVERSAVQSVEWTNTHGTFHFDHSGDTWTPGGGHTIERLDTARVSALVDSVSNLRATDFADANATTGISPDAPHVTLVTGGDAGAQTIVVRLGSNAGENESYVQRDGSPIVFTIGRTAAQALNPDVTAFQLPPPPPDAGVTDATAAPLAPPPGAPPGGIPGGPMAMPGGPGAPSGGRGSLPPEVMEQIRRQLQQQGMHPPPAH